MTTDEYDQLLENIRIARDFLAVSTAQLHADQMELDRLLTKLVQEESRIARESLAGMHSASRKLVVGE